MAPAGRPLSLRSGKLDSCLTRFTFRLRCGRSPTRRSRWRCQATVGELLKDSDHPHDGLKKHLYTDEGRLRNFVNVYLNDEDIRYLQKEQTPVKPGDSLSIVPSVAGGAGGHLASQRAVRS